MGSKFDNKDKWILWKNIASTIEKNDFSCRKLNYGLTKLDKEEMKKLKSNWGKLLGIEKCSQKEYSELRKELND